MGYANIFGMSGRRTPCGRILVEMSEKQATLLKRYIVGNFTAGFDTPLKFDALNDSPPNLREVTDGVYYALDQVIKSN